MIESACRVDTAQILGLNQKKYSARLTEPGLTLKKHTQLATVNVPTILVVARLAAHLGSDIFTM